MKHVIFLDLSAVGGRPSRNAQCLWSLQPCKEIFRGISAYPWRSIAGATDTAHVTDADEAHGHHFAQLVPLGSDHLTALHDVLAVRPSQMVEQHAAGDVPLETEPFGMCEPQLQPSESAETRVFGLSPTQGAVCAILAKGALQVVAANAARILRVASC